MVKVYSTLYLTPDQKLSSGSEALMQTGSEMMESLPINRVDIYNRG